MSDAAQSDSRIAIVGRAGRFPSARNVSQFWELLRDARVATTRLTDEELLAEGVSRAKLADPNYVKAANILPDMECFDAGFFGFSPRDASILDPQHRHFLECAWEALEDAGHIPDSFDGRIGVFAGSGMQAYMPFNLLSNPDLVEEIGLFLLRHTGNDKDFLPTRLSYLLDLQGPSVAVQTACSTSLVAVHMGIQSLLSMESDMVLAGGVTIELPHRVGYTFAPNEILSPDGLCRAFDDNSEGTVFGSGATVVALRRYEDAVADNDDIKAVILGSAINNDGSQKANYLAPSVEGQAEAVGEALALAGLEPDDVTYIEAHGTGTNLGDPIELSALQEIYGDNPKKSLGIGSVKTNIGHLDTAAGGSSLIKVVEAMRHKTLPASLNFETPNRGFDFENSPFYVVNTTREWTTDGKPRRAGINSLGVGGTNAHVIVEEAPQRPATLDEECWRIFSFSAKSEAALDATPEKWLEFLSDDNDTPALSDIAFTLREGRRRFDNRRAIAARTLDDLKAALAGDQPDLIASGSAADETPEIVFMFPGGGAQYPGAGADLLNSSPVFKQAIDDCFAALPENAPADLYEMMFERRFDDEEASQKIAKSGYAIPALFILEYAYAKLWESWGIKPDAILAHSVGEYAGAAVAGILKLADALKIVSLRGRVMDAAPEGAMTTVPATEEKVREIIGDALDIAALNAPELSVVSGTRGDIEALEDKLRGTDLEASRIRIDVAAHSRVLDGQLEPFRKGFDGVSFDEPSVPFVSSMRGDWPDNGDFVTADYWVRHLRSTVRFVDAAAKVLDKPNRIILEVGPGQSLGPLIGMMNGENAPRDVIYSGRKPRTDVDDMGIMTAALGGLWANGVDIDWHKLPGTSGARVSLPTYAFEKQRHWVEPGRGAASEEDSDTASINLSRIQHIDDWFARINWVEDPVRAHTPDLSGRWMVFAGDDPISQKTLDAIASQDGHAVVVRAGEVYEAEGDSYTVCPDTTDDYERLIDALGDLPTNILHLWALDTDDQAHSFDSAFGLLRALQAADTGQDVSLTFATRGSAAVGDETVCSPLSATLKGPVRVGPREIPGLRAKMVDLATDAKADVAKSLIVEATYWDGNDSVAIRGKTRLVEKPEAAPAQASVDNAARVKSGGVYLVTGGSGGIGRELATWLCQTHDANVALLSRSAIPDDILSSLSAGTGGEVISVTADVTDKASLKAAISETGERLGPVNGVFHGAGTINDAPLTLKSLDDAHEVMAPKVDGAANLSDLLPVGTVDFFAVFSSSSVIIGPPGQTDYVAANAYLEALAQSREDGLSIAWGIWRDIGMAAEAYGSGTSDDGIHPLVGPKVAKDDAITFTRVVDPNAEWILTGHVVGGHKVMPGVAFIDMITAAAKSVTEDRFEISALSLGAPLAFHQDLPRALTLSFSPLDDGYDVRISSAAGEDAVEHARAHLIAPAEESSAQELPVPDISPKCIAQKSAQSDEIGFGERWNNVDQIEIWDDVSRGKFTLDTEFADDLADFPLHPAMMDTAATVGLSTLSPAERDGVVYAPISFKNISVNGPLTQTVSAVAQRRPGDVSGFETFDVTITDEKGSILVAIDGLDMRAIPDGNFNLGEGDLSLTEQMLAGGISRVDAAEVFARSLGQPHNRIVVSSLPLDLVRLSMAEARKKSTGKEGATKQVELENPVQTKLAAVWGDLLGAGSIGPKDDFFALGGHSLNAVRMFGRVRKEFDVDMRLATLFEAPTLGAFAQKIIDERPELLTEQATVETQSADTTVADTSDVFQIPPDREIATTQAQREVLSAILIEPEVTIAYNLSFSLLVNTHVDPDAARKAIDALAARHDSLRSNFAKNGLSNTIVQNVEVPFRFVDLSDLDTEEAEAEAIALRQKDVETEIDLYNGPVFKASLIRFGPQSHEVLMCSHHVVSDGWSLRILQSDFLALYNHFANGDPLDLPPKESIAEFVEAEAEFLNSPEAARHAAYWKDAFSGDLPYLNLPTDHPRPLKKTTSAAYVYHTLPVDLEKRLRDLAKRAGSTLQNVLFAAFKLYLARLCGSRDVVLGLPASGQLSFAMDQVVAHCVSLLPVRNRIEDDQTFEAFLDQVRLSILEGLDHQNYTYGSLVRDLKLHRDPSRVALLPIMFNIDSFGEEEYPMLSGHPVRFKVNPRKHEYFDIFFNLISQPGNVELSWTYNTSIFEKETVERHAAALESLLDWCCRNPDGPIGDAPLMPEAESQRLIDLGKGKLADYPREKTIANLFDDQLAKAPDAPAIVEGERRLTCAQLGDRSAAIALHLHNAGVGSGDIVGLCLPRSADLIASMIAIARLGAAFVPLDPANPVERLQYMIDHSGAKKVLSNRATAAGVDLPDMTLMEDIGKAPDAQIDYPDVDPEATFYVPYTSGSTGKPKGVMVAHRSIVNRFYWMWRDYPFEPGEVMCQKTAISFVDSLWETLGPVMAGVPLVVIDEETVRDPVRLFAELGKHSVTRLLVVPSLLRAILTSNIDLSQAAPALRMLWTGGERLTPDLVKQFLASAPQITLFNIYGSSEVTADITWEEIREIDDDADVPIGRPLDNSRVYVLDQGRHLVPMGQTGELYVAGDVLAKGYLNRPDLTAERFVPDHFADDGSLMFATGDRVRYLPDGRLMYEGRTDDQIKIRGYRIELGEIEATMADQPGVAQAAVVLKSTGAGNEFLSAFFTIDGGGDVAADDLRSVLARKLPDYMVPARITAIEAMPLNPNGKIDRNKLVEIDDTPDSGPASPDPSTQTETELQAIWEKVLDQKSVSLDANFFELGGHSLMAVDVFSRINSQFGQELPISTLFEHSTIRQLAAHLDRISQTPALTTNKGAAEDSPWDTSVVIHPGPKNAEHPTLFIVGGVGGNVNNLYEFGQVMGRDRRIVGLQTRGVMGHRVHDSLEAMAADHIDHIRQYQKHGPYYVCGYSGGSMTAFEMARQLTAMGEDVAFVGIIDYVPAPGFRPDISIGLGERLRAEVAAFSKYGLKGLWRRLLPRAREAVAAPNRSQLLFRFSPEQIELIRLSRDWWDAAQKYKGGMLDGNAWLFVNKPTHIRNQKLQAIDPTFGWQSHVSGTLHLVNMEFDHLTMIEGDSVAKFCEIFSRELLAAEKRA